MKLSIIISAALAAAMPLSWGFVSLGSAQNRDQLKTQRQLKDQDKIQTKDQLKEQERTRERE